MSRLIASDLDGTLFGADSQVSPRTRDVIRRVTGRGHVFVAITGRSWMTAWPRLEAVTGIDHLLGSNGACHFRRGQGVVWTRPIAAADASRWAAQIAGQLADVCFGWETAQGIGFDPAFTRAAGGLTEAAHSGDADWPDGQDMIKLYVRAPQQDKYDLQSAVRRLLGEHAEVSTSGAPFIEITAAGVDKSTALQRAATASGLELADTIAFGDNHNDIPMLRAAGLSVAMGNAVADVQAAASRQARSNTEDGVASVLEAMLDAGEL